MSKFHTFLKNDSSSDSEEGELSENNDDLESKQEIIQSNEPKLDSKTLKASKSLQIVDKMDTKRNNRFSIWSDLLLEDQLNQSVSSSMDIKKRPRVRQLDRNSENYSFWTKKQLENDSDNNLSQNTMNSVNNTIIKRKKKNKKKRSDKNKPKAQIVDIVLEMAKKLNEPKIDLLRKVHQTIGEQKTTELLSATMDIESAGGLMTVDGKRRRTPGGVFFQLLKNDANIPKQSIELIFSNENKIFKQKKLKKKSKRKDYNKTSLYEKKIECKSDINENIVTEIQTMD